MNAPADRVPLTRGKLLQLLALPNIDMPDDVGYLWFGLLFAHTSLFWLYNPKPEARAQAEENPPHHALKNVVCGGFKRQIHRHIKISQQTIFQQQSTPGKRFCQRSYAILDLKHNDLAERQMLLSCSLPMVEMLMPT